MDMDILFLGKVSGEEVITSDVFRKTRVMDLSITAQKTLTTRPAVKAYITRVLPISVCFVFYLL